MIYELTHLLQKVRRSEDLVERLEVFFDEHHAEWSPDLTACFMDQLERKKEQIDYEWHLVAKMGDAIAAGRDPHNLDI